MAINQIKKTPTGIAGLDTITNGGLPAGRPTLVAGNAGCGKTLLGMEFLIQGITQYNEPAVFISFEETSPDLIQNVASLGYDLETIIKNKQLRLDYIKVDRTEIEETGVYDLEGLFIRLNLAIDSIKAKRVVLDTIESLFSGFNNSAILRSELRRLFQWLRDKGVTTIITAERGDTTLTRQGLEEYVSDCVILLDHRVEQQISTRRLRIVKYRGSPHGTNEYPFLIDDSGITVMPLTALRLDNEVSLKRISSGIDKLDGMIGGGYYVNSNILVSGTAGTGKTNIATYFANAACERKQRALYIAFEESPQQIVRNAKSIGLDLQKQVDSKLLRFESARSTSLGLEMHLARLYKLIMDFKPSVVVVDPITNLAATGSPKEVQAMLSRMMDLFKAEGVTALMTALTVSGTNLEQTDYGVSSFVDSWLLLRDHEENGERNRLLYVLKSRGSAHSNQVREFLITNKGVDLVDVYLGSAGMLTGTARIAATDKLFAEKQLRTQQIKTSQKQLENKKRKTEAQIASLKAQLEMETAEIETFITVQIAHQNELQIAHDNIMSSRSNGIRGVTKR